jgi:tetratricopeptide (TPR) repeat protein
MKAWTRNLALAICLAAVSTAFAEKELVMLNDGVSGMGEIVSTTQDSLTVKFEIDGNPGEAVLQAKRLDPHSFYGIRSKHMEKTAENHVRLAVWCAESGLFKRAKFQMDRARDLDPEIESKIESDPKIMAGIAQRLVDSAKAAYAKGDLTRAHEIAALQATRFAETEQGQLGPSVLDKLEAEIEAKATEKVAKREKLVQEQADGAAKEEADARDKAMKALEKVQARGRKQNSTGLRANNRTTGKKHFESAANDFKNVLKMIKTRRKSHADDKELMRMLDSLEAQVKGEAVAAYINAGNIELWRENFNGAQNYGKQALEVDPESQAASSFMNKTSTYFHMRGDDWGGRRGGGRR